MLEKIFGKKSTGIIYIFSASILLLSLAAGVITFVLSYPAFKLYYLVVQAVVTAFSLIAISLPVFVQKRFKFFIPPFIEISLCVYVVLLFFLSRFHTSTVILNSFLPSAGGFILSMVIFSIEYSLFSIRAQRQGKKKPSFAAAVLTVLSAFVLILFFAFIFLHLRSDRRDARRKIQTVHASERSFSVRELPVFRDGIFYCTI